MGFLHFFFKFFDWLFVEQQPIKKFKKKLFRFGISSSTMTLHVRYTFSGTNAGQGGGGEGGRERVEQVATPPL